MLLGWRADLAVPSWISLNVSNLLEPFLNDFFLNLVELFSTRGVGVIMTLFERLGRALSTEG
jgi:hypothetical protein